MASVTRPQLVFVDGTFAQLSQEIAESVGVGDKVAELLKKDQEEEALSTIVKSAANLNSLPDKDFTALSNLLIHLVINMSKEPKKHLPQICANFQKVVSGPNGPALALNALQTVFNLLAPTNPMRLNVFLQMLRFLKVHNMYDLLKPVLPNVPKWLPAWQADEEDQRKVYMEIVEIATEAGEEE